MDRKIEVLQYLQKIQNELIENGFKCWLDYGQLLGAKRNGKLLPWDNDIDFGVLIEDRKKSHLVHKIISKYLNLRIPQPNFYIFSRYKKYNYIIDFFYCYPKQNKIHYPFAPKGGLDIRSFFVDELDEIEIEGFKFKCPRHLELYLKIRYGDTWETPIEKSYSFIKTNPGNVYQDKKFHCLTSGVFDLLHEGHIKLFERGKKEFDILTIGIHNDQTVETYKRKPINDQETRYNMIMDLGIADFVIKDFLLVANENVLKDYDFVIFGREDNNEKFYPHTIKNHPVKRTENISTTKLLN